MWIIIISILIIGLVLVVLELVFVPGTTVVGILGLVFCIVAITLAYHHFGNQIGIYFLLGSLIVTAIALYFSFKSDSWSKFSLKSSINSRVNEGRHAVLAVGDTGVTTSTLRPSGKAMIGDIQYEVRTRGNYLRSGEQIKIIEITSEHIFVEPQA